MEKTCELNFEEPSFFKRIKSMLGVDFYRLFHTPLFYIFLAIAAIIPAIILGTSTMEGSEGIGYTSAWNIIAASKPLYVIESIGDYANMNMVFIFGGIMVSIFIGSDYRSGYVKQLFTTHAKKQDYMISKTITCAFSMACMCITYLLGGVVGGLFAGDSVSFALNGGEIFALVCAIIGKMIMSIGWAALYTFINVILRKFFGISIALSFFFGTGILIIGVAGVFDSLHIPNVLLNAFLYGSSVFACLDSGVFPLLAVLICLVVSVAWTVIYIVLGTTILSKSDVY
ncbi:MAG: hypothetical protein IJ437_04710 [Clostridia bacterium]|nr:hypothetical protein [Clostridia bacterium]